MLFARKMRKKTRIWKMSTKCQKHSLHRGWKFKLSCGCNSRLQTITCGILVPLTHTENLRTRHRVILTVNGSTSYYTACNILGVPRAFHSPRCVAWCADSSHANNKFLIQFFFIKYFDNDIWNYEIPLA